MPPLEKLSWPAPPDPARVQFVTSVLSDAQLKTETPLSQEVVDFVSGQKPPIYHIMEPMGLVVSDDAQTLYVADTAYNDVFIFDFSRNTFSKIDGFVHPVGLALDGQQNLYVVDQARKQVVVFDGQGKQIKLITDKSLVQPTGIAIDRQRGKIYVVDTANAKSDEHNVKIFAMDGKLIGKIGKGRGIDVGYFQFPTYIALDNQGHVFVTDTLNNRIQEFSSNGEFVRTIGQNSDAPGGFARPKGLAVDTFGNLYVADSGWSNVQIFSNTGQLLMFFGGRGPMPGLLANPTAMAIDKNNRIYVGDYINHRVEEYQLVNTAAVDPQAGPLMTAADK